MAQQSAANQNPLVSFSGEVALLKASPDLVRAIQQQLNRAGFALICDGIPGPRTVAAFRSFKALHYLGGLDTLGTTTAKALLATPSFSKFLNTNDFNQAAKFLGCDVRAIKAIVQVEAAGSGFFPNGTPKILFEAHWFDYFTGGKYRASHPNLSSSYWNRHLYLGGQLEYKRLSVASTLNKTAALKSTSWGLGQVMGYNYNVCGYNTVDTFVDAMHKSEGLQLMAMCAFIKSSCLDDELRAKNWAGFAYGYNGEGYRANNYHTRLAEAYNRAVA